MAHLDKHAAGTSCRVELGTTSQEAAKRFYSSLFGWTPVDHPMGPVGAYTIFQIDARDAAAACQMGEREAGVPPHRNLYIAVEDADQTAARASELGATVPAGVFDVGPSGRMGVILDPTGAALSIWQGKQTPGAGVIGENNSYVWADLSTGDRLSAKRFYQGLFGWTIKPGQGERRVDVSAHHGR